jgi:hypothetical protein
MTKRKLLAIATVLSTIMIAPAMAQQVYYRGHDGYRDRGPVDAAAGIAGFTVGTAAAIATAPLRDSYAYDNTTDQDWVSVGLSHGRFCRSKRHSVCWQRGHDCKAEKAHR